MQEYVDHGSCVYKFYIIGDKVYHSCRRSMPNAASLAVSGGSSGGLPALVFDRYRFMLTRRMVFHAIISYDYFRSLWYNFSFYWYIFLPSSKLCA